MNYYNILSLDTNKLNSLDTSFINNFNLYHETSYFSGISGREHYRLLMYISTLLDDSIIFDIGTNKCMSAIALSYNKKNKVKSYDMLKILPENPKIDNIEFLLGDCTQDDDIKKSNFLFLDVAHDGIFENKLYLHLKNIKWSGILMLDDINLNKEMIEFWNQIEEKKFDITRLGHWCGTGMVIFE